MSSLSLIIFIWVTSRKIHLQPLSVGSFLWPTELVDGNLWICSVPSSPRLVLMKTCPEYRFPY